MSRCKWKTSLWGLVLACLFCVALAASGLVLLVDGARSSDRATGAVIMLLAPIGWWLFAWRPNVVLTADAVIVQNPYRRYSVPLDSITGVQAGWGGLELRLAPGRKVTGWAVQKANWSKVRKRHTRADEVAATIRRAAQRARAATNSV